MRFSKNPKSFQHELSSIKFHWGSTNRFFLKKQLYLLMLWLHIFGSFGIRNSVMVTEMYRNRQFSIYRSILTKMRISCFESEIVYERVLDINDYTDYFYLSYIFSKKPDVFLILCDCIFIACALMFEFNNCMCTH